MVNEINRFVAAHDRYLALDGARANCTHPAQRERLHIEILQAYLEVQYCAQVIAGLQHATGMDFADAN
ncbi:MAG TPA: hypothetical protein VGQ71_03575 [Terriglobales bacterium]|jgi:hypothetical protein|nr:hypothetical protein [Terriglobales bacterium]